MCDYEKLSRPANFPSHSYLSQTSRLVLNLDTACKISLLLLTHFVYTTARYMKQLYFRWQMLSPRINYVFTIIFCCKELITNNSRVMKTNIKTEIVILQFTENSHKQAKNNIHAQVNSKFAVRLGTDSFSPSFLAHWILRTTVSQSLHHLQSLVVIWHP